MVDQQRLAPGAPSGGAFGPNAWLVDDMYEEYRSDPSSVSESWREFFADYSPPGAPTSAAAAVTSTGNGAPATANGSPPATGVPARNGAPASNGAPATAPAPAPLAVVEAAPAPLV